MTTITTEPFDIQALKDWFTLRWQEHNITSRKKTVSICFLRQQKQQRQQQQKTSTTSLATATAAAAATANFTCMCFSASSLSLNVSSASLVKSTLNTSQSQCFLSFLSHAFLFFYLFILSFFLSFWVKLYLHSNRFAICSVRRYLWTSVRGKKCRFLNEKKKKIVHHWLMGKKGRNKNVRYSPLLHSSSSLHRCFVFRCTH